MSYFSLSLTSISTVVHVIVTLSTVYGKACRGLPVALSERRWSDNTELVVFCMIYALEPRGRKNRSVVCIMDE